MSKAPLGFLVRLPAASGGGVPGGGVCLKLLTGGMAGATGVLAFTPSVEGGGEATVPCQCIGNSEGAGRMSHVSSDVQCATFLEGGCGTPLTGGGAGSGMPCGVVKLGGVTDATLGPTVPGTSTGNVGAGAGTGSAAAAGAGTGAAPAVGTTAAAAAAAAAAPASAPAASARATTGLLARACDGANMRRTGNTHSAGRGQARR